jgi:hypothetical protein
MTIDWSILLAAFGGGVFGSALGAVPVFVFTGVLVLIGVATVAAGGDPRLIGDVAFGPFFGPHVSFAGAVAAAAYAGRKQLMPNGRDIGKALMGFNNAGVLVVGGLFGMIGSLLNTALVHVGGAAWTDTIALTVVLSAFAVRFIFGKTSIFGTVADGCTRFYPTDLANWLPWQQNSRQLFVIGLAVGVMSGRLAQMLGAQKGGDVIGFGLVTTCLVFLLMGSQIPVTHHIAISSAVAATLGAGLITCALVGVIAAFVAEGFSRTFQIHGDTHIDPPAGAIAIVITLLRVAAHLGIFTHRLP